MASRFPQRNFMLDLARIMCPQPKTEDDMRTCMVVVVVVID